MPTRTRARPLCRQEPFKLKAFQQSMQANGFYKCSINFAWQDIDNHVGLGVPLNKKRIDDLVEFYFQNPAPMPLETTLAVDSDKVDPLAKK
eukprot:2219779-Alexandrium_andersonii.AAC.1